MPGSPELLELLGRRRAEGGPALVEGLSGRTLRWSDVAAVADRWAEEGPPGARVGLAVADPLEMAACFVGAMAAGYTVAPLDPSAPRSELDPRVLALGLDAVATGQDTWAATATGDGGRATPDAALLMATSGTTGRPKLIPLTAVQLLRTAQAVASAHRLTPEDCGYSPLPLWHINGLVVGVLSSLVGGHRLVLDRRFQASTFWGVVEGQRVTWLNLVPAIISVLADRPAPAGPARSRVRFARSASAPLPVTAIERFEALTGIPVVETYGMTEAGSQITANPVRRRRPGSVGRACGVELRVVDECHRAVPLGVLGQVEIRGESVVAAYWRPADEGGGERPARTDGGWLPTGDVGRLDPDGYLWLEGRADDVINRGGEKVYPREVEEVLRRQPGVAEAAVVGRPHPTVGEEPVAFVVAAGNPGPALVAQLAERCSAELSRYKRPVEIEVVDSLPSGPNGKIRRAELRRLLSGGAG